MRANLLLPARRSIVEVEAGQLQRSKVEQLVASHQSLAAGVHPTAVVVAVASVAAVVAPTAVAVAVVVVVVVAAVAVSVVAVPAAAVVAAVVWHSPPPDGAHGRVLDW